MKDPKLRKVTFPHTQVKWNPIYSPKKPSEVCWLTRSGYLSLSNRIARGTKPLSLYDSSPVGDYEAKTNHDTPLCGIEWKSSHSHPAKKKKHQTNEKVGRQKGAQRIRTLRASGTLGKSTTLLTPTSRAFATWFRQCLFKKLSSIPKSRLHFNNTLNKKKS